MQVLTTKQASEKLKIGENEICRLAACGELPCLRRGNRYLFLESDLEAWLREQIDRQTAERRARFNSPPAAPAPAQLLPKRRGRQPIPTPDFSQSPHLVSEV